MDKRRNNGNKGHSTKAKGADKRKNEYRKAIEQACTFEDVKKLLTKCMAIALSEEKDRMKALSLVLEYTLEKPKESLDVSAKVEGGISFNELIAAIKQKD